ncbi:hypothetical protein [Pedobacter metabolipauper]|nr:hypothetical protein [Pedobacter metabolipauper]
MEKSASEKKVAFMLKCNADPDLKDFEEKKRIALHALKICKGNITNACLMINLSRKMFHNYMTDDADFKEMVSDIRFTITDGVVDKLLLNCEAGKETSIIYYLNCQGKHLGYGNNVNIDHTTKGDSLNKALKNMTDEELEQKLKELNAKMK